MSVRKINIRLACRDFEPVNLLLDGVFDKTHSEASLNIRSLVWEKVRFPVVMQTVFQARDQIAVQVRDER